MIRKTLAAIVAGLLLAGGLHASAVAAPLPAAAPAPGPALASLMGSKPPAGDPLKLGKRIAGTVPANKARSLKSMPKPPTALPAAKTPTGGPFYFYAVGKQAPVTPPSGVSANLTVSKPYLNPTYDYHTLGELAVQSADEQQIVEIGWTRDQNTFGDNNVHLFAYHWVNGHETCYGCGFVDYGANTAFTHGSSLEAYLQTDMIFAIERTATAWWLGFGPAGAQNWIGSFPDTEWTNATPPVTTFKQVNLFQGFGEVAAGTSATAPNPPCADMGLGPTAATASPGPPAVGAKVGSVTYTGQPSTTVSLTVGSTVAQYPTAIPAGNVAPFRSFRYSGKGWC